MKLPRDLSGADLAAALQRRWNYLLVHQVGSHMVLETSQPTGHRIVVPAHRFLKIGTLNSILRAVAQHKRVSKQDILDSI